jgi:transposase InsO family protein
MLGEVEFARLCERLGLPPEGISVIENIRSSPPARRVQGGAGNVRRTFNNSLKMGVSLQSESRTVEFPAILLKEMIFKNVLEYYDQPPSFVVNYQVNGKNRGYVITPDFFVINEDSAGWEEWKPEEKLLKLAEAHPNRYYFGEDGRWHFIPGERYAEQYGLFFHVHSSKEIPPTTQRNLRVLLPFYSRCGEIDTDTQLFRDLRSTIAENPGITLADLLERVEGARNGDIFELLLTKQVYVDLSLAFLGDEDEVRLFSDELTSTFFTHLASSQAEPEARRVRTKDLIPNTSILLDGTTVELFHVGTTGVTLKTSDGNFPKVPTSEFEKWISEGRVTGYLLRPGIDPRGKAHELAARRRLTDVQMIEVLDKEQVVLKILAGERVAVSESEARKHRMWVAAYRAAERKHGNGLVGLMPGRKGNRTDRLMLRHPNLRTMMLDFIKDKVEAVANLTKAVLYGEFRLLCKGNGIHPPSMRSFMKMVKARKGAEQTTKIEGSKAGYQQEEHIDDEYYTTPVHGDRAWEFAHLDHTEMDVVLRHSETERVFRKAWITLLICAFTRRVLAHYISFAKPSRVSCMGVIRECVRRWGRLPECIVVDGGSEFKSVYFEKLLARYKCDVQWRPPTRPRFGSIIERFIHTLNKQFLHNLLGNTKIMKRARQVTKSVNPENHAVWNLPLLDEHLEMYFYDEYDNREHSRLGRSPREAFEASLQKFPAPPPCEIEYDENFTTQTMLPAEKLTRKVKQSRGVSVYGTWYKSKKLRDPALYDKQVPVNLDWFDVSHVYAYIRGQWEECFAPARVFSLLKGKSVRLMQVISEEERERARAYGRRSNARFEELALKQARREETEREQQQRLKDAELGKIAERKAGRGSLVLKSASVPEGDEAEAPDNVVDLNEVKTYSRMRRG